MPRHFRLVIRNAANDGDEVVLSSLPSDTNPYIASVPSGIGAEIDPRTGKTVLGEVAGLVVDNGNEATALTSVLADANGRDQLLDRHAQWLKSDNSGSSWDTLIDGFVVSIGLVDGATYEVRVGDSRRKERTTTVFDHVEPGAFFGVPSLIGGPLVDTDLPGIPGPPLPRTFGLTWNYNPGGGNPWIVTTTYVGSAQASGEKEVWFRLVRGWVSTAGLDDEQLTTLNTNRANIPGWTFVTSSGLTGIVLNGVVNRIQRACAPYALRYGGDVTGFAPFIFGTNDRKGGVRAYIKNSSGTVVTAPVITASPSPEEALPLGLAGEFKTLWPADAAFTPSVNDKVKAWMFIDEVSNANPIIVSAHPIDLLEATAPLAGVTFTQTSLNDVRGDLLPGVRLLLRFTGGMAYEDFESGIVFATFGLNKRPSSDGNGTWELVQTRETTSETAPSETITTSQLRDAGGRVFDLNESTIINTVIFESERFRRWDKASGTAQTPDNLLTSKHRHTVDSTDVEADSAIVREHKIKLPGTLYFADGDTLEALEGWQEDAARAIFGRYLRGGKGCELHCTPDVTAEAGDEVLVNLPHLPVPVGGSAVRGGARRMMVLRRTNTEEGPDLKLVDTGHSTSIGVTPTFSLAADTVDPKRYAALTLTNAATLNGTTNLDLTALVTATSDVSYGGGIFGSRGLPWRFLGTAPSIATDTRLGAFPTGAQVGVRLLATRPGFLPVATSVQTLQLTALNPPSALTITPSDGTALVQWTTGELNAQTEVFLREASLNTTYDVLAALAPAGVAQTILRTPDSGSMVATLRHSLDNALSSVISSAFTASAASYIATAPKTIRVSKAADYLLELRTRAFDFPGIVQFQYTGESDVTAGQPFDDGWVHLTSVAAVQGDDTTAFVVVPSHLPTPYSSTLSAGDYTLSGADATLTGPLTLDLDAGTYTMTGAASDLSYVSGAWTGFLRPDQDFTSSTWLSTGLDRFGEIDETTQNDSDYAYTTTAGRTLHVGLSAPGGTVSGSATKTLRWGINVTPVGGSDFLAVDDTIQVFEGTTLVQTFGANGGDGSAAVTNSITDYSDLRVKVTSDSALVDDQYRVTWVELEIS